MLILKADVQKAWKSNALNAIAVKHCARCLRAFTAAQVNPDHLLPINYAKNFPGITAAPGRY